MPAPVSFCREFSVAGFGPHEPHKHLPIVAAVPIAVVLAPLVTVMFAALIGLVAFVSPMTSLRAVGAEVLDGLVIAPFGVRNAAVASTALPNNEPNRSR